MLLASPAVALWSFRNHNPLKESHPSPSLAYEQPAGEAISRIPVEVIEEGSEPQWVYVQVGNQAIPEPGMVSLLALTTFLFAFRRQRN